MVKGAELRGHFGFVDDDDFALAGLGDDFFVKEGTAAAFDEIEVRVDFIGTVDGEVDGGGALIVDEREPGGGGFTGHFGGGGEAAEAGELSGLMKAGDLAEGVDRGRAGAEADDGAGFDEADGIDGGGVLEGVLVERAHGVIVPFLQRDGRNFRHDRRVLTVEGRARSIRGGARAPIIHGRGRAQPDPRVPCQQGTTQDDAT